MTIIPTPSFPMNYKCSFLWVTSLFIFPSFLSTSISIPLPLFFPPFSLPSFLSFLSSLCVLGTRSRGSSNSSIASELDDEPPCLEEVDYGTDISSDQEGSFSELDRQIQECAFHKDEGEEEEEGTGQGRKTIP